MFGYELVDILLFDIETLTEVYRYYLESVGYWLYLSLVANVLSVLMVRAYPRWVAVYLCACWVVPGYFFFIKEFSQIYWPATFLGWAAIAFGALQVLVTARNPIRASRLSQCVFAVATIAPAVASFAIGTTILGLGTSASVAAAGTFSLHSFEKGLASRFVAAVSFLWCFLTAVVLWNLRY